jgi:hypothetical protein
MCLAFDIEESDEAFIRMCICICLRAYVCMCHKYVICIRIFGRNVHVHTCAYIHSLILDMCVHVSNRPYEDTHIHAHKFIRSACTCAMVRSLDKPLHHVGAPTCVCIRILRTETPKFCRLKRLPTHQRENTSQFRSCGTGTDPL